MALVGGDGDLTARLARLDSLFGASALSDRSITKVDIAKYYSHSALGYTMVHSLEGAIHMALSPTGEFDRRDYGRQSQIIKQWLESSRSRRAVELGCGRGYNLVRIGSRLRATELIGIDITPAHVRSARRRVRKLPHVAVGKADFESMPFADGSVEAAYSVESFCHAVNLQGALCEAARVVRRGGLLILIDAWRRPSRDELTPGLRRALDVIQKSMAIAQATPLGEWISVAARAGWRLIAHDDYSDQVMPNLERFERLASALVTRQRLASLASLLAPRHLMNNVIAGYLMAQSMRQKCYTYGLLVMRRM